MENIEIYDIIKIIHLVAVISWLATLLYLPRLFVYHCRADFNSQACLLFQEMERKLYRYIATPAMIITIICGFYLAIQIGFDDAIWLHIKITLVFILLSFHLQLNNWRKKFAKGANRKSAKFFKIINELPTIIMIIIVSLVILKPF